MIQKDSPEGKLLRVTWRSIIGMAGPVSEQYKWTLTAIAAALALIISNLESLQKVVADGYLKGSLTLLVLSVLLAAIAYMLSEAVKLRAEVTNHLESVLSTPQAQEVLGQIRLDPKTFMAEAAKPFFGPLGWLMRRGAEDGGTDPFSTEKGSIKLIVWQAYTMWAGLVTGAIGIVVLILGLK